MSFVHAARCMAGILILATALSFPATAQTSIGFENPGDTTSILEYRLPDWGYRTWDLNFDFSGGGSDSYRGDAQARYNNRVDFGLASGFYKFRESEDRTFYLSAHVGGDYNRSHQGRPPRESSGHRLNGRLGLGGGLTEYLGDGPFFLLANGRAEKYYAESIFENRDESGLEESRNYSRDNHYVANVGAGWGRARDVTPLIRAQRLSERLAALGRPRLAASQVQEIARVLATEHGYRNVFDRPDRSFWRDVLEPMLDPDQPLSVYEIFYLRDIMAEDVGPRRQGTEVRGYFLYQEYESQGQTPDYRQVGRGPALAFLWVRNLSFDHQLTWTMTVNHERTGHADIQWETVRGILGLDHLWTIADRYRWDTSLEVVGSYGETSDAIDHRIERDLTTRLESTFSVYLENSLSLRGWIRGMNVQQYADYTLATYQEVYSREWNWYYGIGLKYYLDRVLY